MFKRKRAEAPPSPEPHPNPEMELKLRNIRDLDRMRTVCFTLIEDCRSVIIDAESNITKSVGYCRSDWISPKKLEAIIEVETVRIKRQEERIREQQARITSLSSQISEAVSEADLSEFDLAYLRLAAEA
jgi:hypothetical protein